MKKNNFFFFVCLAVSLVCITACKYGIVQKPKNLASLQEDSIYTKSILEKSKNGYWLVARGYKWTDDLVATATVTDYSHAAVLDMSTQSVIEADSKGVHESSLAHFVNHSYRITIVKPGGYTSPRGVLAVQVAREKLGKPYDFLGTVGLNNPDKYYCSELAACSYSHLKDSLKLPLIVEPVYLLKLGTVIYETPERKIK